MKQIELFKLLCQVIAPDGCGESIADNAVQRRLLSSEDVWPDLIRMAGNGLVTPTLAGSLQRKGLFGLIPREAQQYVSGIQALNRERNATLRKELKHVVATMNRMGIEPLLIKGAINLVGEQYPGCEDRLLSDIDLMLPPEQAQKAWEELQKKDYGLEENSKLPLNHHHLPELLHTNKPVSLELHLHAIGNTFQPLLPADWIWKDSALASWNASEIRVPGATSRILMTFVHAQLQDMGHLVRNLSLRSLLEFSWQARAFEGQIDWGRLDHILSQEFGGKHYGAWLTWLHASHALFACPIPGDFTPRWRDKWAFGEIILSMNSNLAHSLLFQKRRVRIGLKRRLTRLWRRVNDQ